MFDDYLRQDYSQLLRCMTVLDPVLTFEICSAARKPVVNWRLARRAGGQCASKLAAHPSCRIDFCRSPPRGVTLHILRALRRWAHSVNAPVLQQGRF